MPKRVGVIQRGPYAFGKHRTQKIYIFERRIDTNTLATHNNPATQKKLTPTLYQTSAVRSAGPKMLTRQRAESSLLQYLPYLRTEGLSGLTLTGLKVLSTTQRRGGQLISACGGGFSVVVTTIPMATNAELGGTGRQM